MTKRMLTLISLSFFLTSCSTLQSITSAKSPTWPWKDKPSHPCPTPDSTSACKDIDALNAYIKAVEFCKEVHDYYDNGGSMAKNAKFGIGLLGTISGAIMAPISTGSAQTAYAGFSGAANGMQTSFEESFSSSFNLSKVIAVADAGSSAIERYKKTATEANTKNSEKVILAIGIAYECSVAPNRADKAMINALSNP
ncbi:MAG: hypothetical protein ACT6RZ_08335 [Methylophilus sp.]|uniref:hypothetical protein n=2 Tax=Methylophilus sp. TaxID=29541 RepID=UPI0040373DDE